MTRSGSRLAFEPEKAILENYGMPQDKITFKGLENWIENYLPEKFLSDIDSLKKINEKTLNNFVVFNYIVGVTLKKSMCAECLVCVMNKGDVLNIIHTSLNQQFSLL